MSQEELAAAARTLGSGCRAAFSSTCRIGQAGGVRERERDVRETTGYEPSYALRVRAAARTLASGCSAAFSSTCGATLPSEQNCMNCARPDRSSDEWP